MGNANSNSATLTTQRRAIAAAAAVIVTIVLLQVSVASAAAVLTVEPLTWDTVGLDAGIGRDPADGPNAYLVGARVCNTGDAPATDLETEFTWGSANAFITLRGVPVLSFGTLAAGECVDAYYDIEVDRVADAIDTTRDYSITATAGGATSVAHSGQLLVEGLISQARNDAITIDGPTTVYVGEVVQYTLTSQTATAYDDLEVFLDFPNTIFRILSVDVTYTEGQASNDRIYVNNAGGDITTVFTVEIVGTGTATMFHLIFDKSGGSYHYNSDIADATVGAEMIIVNAINPPPDLAIDKSHSGTFQANDPIPQIYTIDVSNVGDGPTDGITTVTDTLPSGLTFVEAQGTGWACDHAAGTVPAPRTTSSRQARRRRSSSAS